jgi:hypothetical protein
MDPSLRVAPGSSSRDNNYPPLLSATEKSSVSNAPPLSQLESNIRRKLNPVEADNIVLAASPKNG